MQRWFFEITHRLLVRFAPPAIASDERAGLNWNGGIIGNCRDKNDIVPLTQRSSIPKFHHSMNEICSLFSDY